jgi:hypothetical protein
MPRIACVVALSITAATALPAQAPAAVEVVGPASVPSDALVEQLKKGEDELVLFDVGYGVREAVVKLHEDWTRAEARRAVGVCLLLEAMEALWTREDAVPDERACRDVARVAMALLDARYRDEGARELTNERAEVEAAGAGTLRFLPVPASISWEDARPRGGYARSPQLDDGQRANLYRATVYLHTYLSRWPPGIVRRWRDTASACRAVGAASQLAYAERWSHALFGARLADGLPVPVVAPDHAWLRSNAAHVDEANARLTALFTALPTAVPESMADGVLRLCHLLVTAEPTAPVLAAMAPAQWRAKWRDAATFAYVGLREVDCAMRAVGKSRLRAPPRVVVEPLPEVWTALRWLDRRRAAALAVDYPDLRRAERSWVDAVLDALSTQQRGEELPSAAEAQLLHLLLDSFDAPDLLLGALTEVDGVAPPLRRAVPHFVRVPVVWRGEVRKALALRLHVEQQDERGQWHGPPWGIALRTDAAATAR